MTNISERTKFNTLLITISDYYHTCPEVHYTKLTYIGWGVGRQGGKKGKKKTLICKHLQKMRVAR